MPRHTHQRCNRCYGTGIDQRNRIGCPSCYGTGRA